MNIIVTNTTPDLAGNVSIKKNKVIQTLKFSKNSSVKKNQKDSSDF